MFVLFFVLFAFLSTSTQAKTFDIKEVNLLVGTEVSYYPGVARYPEKRLTTALPLGAQLRVFGSNWVGFTASLEGHLSFEKGERLINPFVQNEVGVVFYGRWPRTAWSAGFLQQFWKARYTPGLVARFNVEVGRGWEVSASVGNSVSPFLGLGVRYDILDRRGSR